MKKFLLTILSFVAFTISSFAAGSFEVYEDFESGSLPSGWMASGSADYYTPYVTPANWTAVFTAVSGEKIVHSMDNPNALRNEVLYTPMVKLAGGKEATFSFYFNSTPEKLGPTEFYSYADVLACTAQSLESSVKELGTTGKGTGAWQEVKFVFTPEKDGEYCFAIAMKQSSDLTRSHGDIHIDDVIIEGMEPDGGAVTPPATEPLAIVSTTPANGDVVESFKDMTVVLNKPVYFDIFSGYQPVLKNAAGETLKTFGLVYAHETGVHQTAFAGLTLADELVFEGVPVTEPGEYTVIIYENSFRTDDDAEALPRTEIKFTIPAAAEPLAIVSTDPANGAVVESFKDMKVVLNKPVYFDLFNGYQPVLKNAAGETLKTFGLVYAHETGLHQSAFGGLTLADEIVFEGVPVTEPGEYTVIIYENSFRTDDDAEALPRTEIKFTIPAPAAEPLAIVSTTPADGEAVGNIYEIKVEFNQEVWYDSMMGYGVCLINSNGDKTFGWGADYPGTTGYHEEYGAKFNLTKTIVFFANAPITEPGEYTFRIFEETIKTNDNSQVLPRTDFKINIKGEDSIQFLSVDPAEGVVSSLQTIKVETDTDLFGASGLTLTDANGQTYAIKNCTVNPYDKDIYAYVTVTLAEEITAPGTYTLNIPEASITPYGSTKKNKAQSYTWTIEEPAAAPLGVATQSITEGATLPSFKEVTVEFNKAIYDGATDKSATLRDADNKIIATLKAEVLDNLGSHSTLFGSAPLFSKVRFYTETPITEAGNYFVQIPADKYATDDNSEWLGKTVINFTIEASAPAITATWSMENGATVETFESVSITFTGADITSAKSTSMYPFWFYEKNAEGEYVLTANSCSSPGLLDATASGTTVTLGVDPGCYSKDYVSPFDRKGDYRIVIPAGGIKFNNDASNLNTEEYVFDFTIYNEFVAPTEIDAKYTANPENNATISEIREIVVTFNEYSEITIAEPDFMTGSNIPQAFIADPDFGMQMPAGYMMFRAGNAANELVLYVDPAYTGGLDAFNVEGLYTIMVPAGVVKFGNDINKEFQLNYTVSDEVVTPSLIFNANEYDAVEYPTLTCGIFTFAQGAESTKPWIVDANDKKFSNGHVATKRIKPQTDKNIITAEIPEAGKLVFAVISSSSSSTDRTLSVKQNDTELYGKVVNDANDKVDGVYNVHEVAVEAGTATITMPNGTLNFYYIEFIPGAVIEDETLAIVSTDPANGAVVESFKDMKVVLNKPVYFDIFSGYQPALKNAAGETLTTFGLIYAHETGLHQTAFAGLTLADELVFEGVPVTEPGEYTVIIYENSFRTDDDAEVLPRTEIKFTIEAATPAVTATWSMENGATVETFTSVDITFAGADITSAKSTSMYPFWFYEKNADGEYVLTTNECNAGLMDATASGTTITLGVDPACYSADHNSPFSRKGDYRIVIPVGGIQFNGDKANVNTEEYVLDFTIYNEFVAPTEIDAKYTANPENNATLTEIREIVVTFTEYAEITVAEPDFMTGANIPQALITDPDFGMQMPAGYMMFRAGKAANELVLYVDPAYTGGLDAFNVEGLYTIMVPAGVVKFGNDINSAFELNYTVAAAEEKGLHIVSSTPADGATVEAFDGIMTVEFSDEVQVVGGLYGGGQTVLYTATGTNINAFMVDVNSSNKKQVTLTLLGDEKITDGEYQVVFPENTYKTLDGMKTLPKTTISFTVGTPVIADDIYIVSTTPAIGSTVVELSEIQVVFNTSVFPAVAPNIYDEDGSLISATELNFFDENGDVLPDNMVNVVLATPVTEQKVVYLVFPAESVIQYPDMACWNTEELRVMFNVSGQGAINGIVADPVNGYVVYDLNGYLVMQTKKASDLKRLNNGIYIINGTKVLLTK